MSDAEHVSLLSKLKQVDGFVILSGYNSSLYQDHLKDWTCFKKTVTASAHRGGSIRHEHLWLNKSCASFQNQMQLNFMN